MPLEINLLNIFLQWSNQLLHSIIIIFTLSLHISQTLLPTSWVVPSISFLQAIYPGNLLRKLIISYDSFSSQFLGQLSSHSLLILSLPIHPPLTSPSVAKLYLYCIIVPSQNMIYLQQWVSRLFQRSPLHFQDWLSSNSCDHYWVLWGFYQ